MLSLNLMIGFLWLLLFFNGYSDGWEMYTLPPRDADSEIQYVIDGTTFKMPKHDELIYYALPGNDQISSSYCKNIDPTTFKCRNSVYMHLFDMINFKFFIRDHNLPEQHWVLKTDIIVLNPIQNVNYPIDVVTFSIPAYCLYIKNEEYLKVLITVQQVIMFYIGHDATNFHIYLTDPEDKCREYRPKETLWGNKRFNLNLFANKKWTKYAYYFIKNGKHICAYSLNYEDLFHGTRASAHEIKPVNFQLIDTYPTENYHPDFFCIDPLYGTFVSLYWNQDPNTPPEAHYYIINEKDLKNIQLIDRMVLKGFDMEIVKTIFNDNWDGGKYGAAFQSYGRQIFIWYKPTFEGRYVFNGLWKNEDEKLIFSEEAGLRILWHAKKSYIQYDQPVGRYDAPSLPPPISLFPLPPTTNIKPTTTTTKPTTTTPRSTTTTSTTTTTKATTTTTTTEATTTTLMQTTTTMLTSTTTPSTSLPSTSTITTPSNSMPSTTSQRTTSSISSITSNDTNFTQSTPSIVPSINNSRSDSLSGTKDNECSTDKNDLYLWLLIVIIVIDVIEAIILVILVILKFRGAKKIKEAMARKKSLKSIKKKPKPKEKSMSKKKKKMPWKKAKKSIKEKSVTTKTEDAVSGKTADEKSTTNQTGNQTNYYTINNTFNQDSKKKKNGK